MMLCINCKHMENMDYILGVGICAIMEGETVTLSDECICPKDIYDAMEDFLRSNGKEFCCNVERRTEKSNQEIQGEA